MSKNDWNRIQAQLHRRQIEEERRRSAEEDKMARHQRSLTETKNWANTIAVSSNELRRVSFQSLLTFVKGEARPDDRWTG